MNITFINDNGDKHVSIMSYNAEKDIMDILTNRANSWYSRACIYKILIRIYKEYRESLFHVTKMLGINKYSDFESVIEHLHENEECECYSDDFYRYIGEYGCYKYCADTILEEINILENSEKAYFKEEEIIYNNDDITIILK